MAQSILRQIVAGPRARHPEAGLDLCYVTDTIIATSGPSGTYPQRAYRNPLDQLVAFLDERHGNDWAIWEFRAEGTGYEDSAVYNRIWHFPWPDHHPPPFALVPRIMASMRDWHAGGPGRVIVGHCKAGKGRTGSMTVSYLMSEQGWTKAEALARFTQRRMRPGMGAGVSIPSQLRWLDYVERWSANGKHYVETAVQITEVHVTGLRDGVKIGLEGFVDEGRTIKTFHVFRRSERDDYESSAVSAKNAMSPSDDGKGESDDEYHDRPTNTLVDVVAEVMGKASKKMMRSRSMSKERKPAGAPDASESLKQNALGPVPAPSALRDKLQSIKTDVEAKHNTVYRPSVPVVIPTSDINLAIERRSRAGYGWTLVTSVAHVWFNTFFEGQGPEKGPEGAEQSGVFSIDWEAMDGIKGSARKGPRAFDRVSVVWSVVKDPRAVTDATSYSESSPVKVQIPRIIEEPAPGEPVTGTAAASKEVDRSLNDARRLSSDLGLRLEETNSAGVSKATSIVSEPGAIDNERLTADSRESPSDNVSEDSSEGVNRGVHLPDDEKPSEPRQ